MAPKNEDARGKSGREFVISRVFNAPRRIVFLAWTELDRLKQWWGPKGFEMHSCTLDLKPGGKFYYFMSSPDGQEMWGKLVYREISPPDRLVFVASFSDKDGGFTRHPMSNEWPLEVLSTVTFVEEEGKTTMTMRGVPISATEGEQKTFEAGFEGMQIGWKDSMSRLAELAESVSR